MGFKLRGSMNSDRSSALTALVSEVVNHTPVYDIHTHLYDPAFGELLLWGIDDLLTYHYLVAEGFRSFEMPYEKFWALSKTQQADALWNALFIENSPVSEACRGVLTTLNRLGMDVKKRDLPALRQHYASWKPEAFITRALDVAQVRKICMTNSPFDDLERPVWERGFSRDPRFSAALRIDPLLLDWENTAPKLRAWGYEVEADLSGKPSTKCAGSSPSGPARSTPNTAWCRSHRSSNSRRTPSPRSSSNTRSCRTDGSGTRRSP